jgi:hypothetical protein
MGRPLGRWAENEWAVGTATIKTVGERVYILFKQGDHGYLIDTRKEGTNRLIGKYLILYEHRDTYPSLRTTRCIDFARILFLVIRCSDQTAKGCRSSIRPGGRPCESR